MADLDDMPHPTRISPAAARSVVDPDRLVVQHGPDPIERYIPERGQ